MVTQGNIIDNLSIDLERHVQQDNNTSARSKPSRIVSLSSLLGSTMPSSNYSSMRQGQESQERIGFRKLAKAYLWGSSTKNEKDEETMEEDVQENNLQSSKTQTFHPKSGTKILFKDTKSKDLLEAEDHVSRYSVKKRRHSSNTTDTITNDEGYITAKTNKLSIHDPRIDYQLDQYGIPQRIPDLYRDSDSSGNQTKSENVIVDSDEDEIMDPELDARRVAIFRNLPDGTGLQSILTQVQGGPLEKIVKLESQDGKTLVKSLELHFINHQDAKNFITYGRTRLFKINGQHLQPEWASKKVNDFSNQRIQLIYEQIYPKNEKIYSHHGTASIGTGARRCLILKKNVMKKSKSGSRHYPSPKSHLSPLNVDEIKADFGKFGEIVDITPMISRKLCISVNFYDVRSAILAKESYEYPNSYLNSKYHSDWTMWYGRDITDKPCAQL